MKNLKIKLGLFSLLAVLAVSIILTSCEQDTLQENTLNTEVDTSENISEVQSFIIQTPEGLSIEEAIEWAKNHKETAVEVEDTNVDDLISNRSGCTSWETYDTYDAQRVCSCNGTHLGCWLEYHYQEKWCFGWSSSCEGSYCVKRYTRVVDRCVQ